MATIRELKGLLTAEQAARAFQVPVEQVEKEWQPASQVEFVANALQYKASGDVCVTFSAIDMNGNRIKSAIADLICGPGPYIVSIQRKPQETT